MSRIPAVSVFILSVFAFAPALDLAAQASSKVTYLQDMEIPLDWSDVSMAWGASGSVDFCYQEPGKDGKALHLTNIVIEGASECANFQRGQGCYNEGRALQWNHKPGTRATIAFDFAMLQEPDPSTWVRVCYYDGYVSAEFFQENWQDEFYKVPKPLLDWNSGDETGWRHIEAETGVLEYDVLTLWIQVAHTCEGNGNIDAAFDNLAVTLEPSDEFYDPGLGWGGTDYDKMTHCRRSNNCRQIPWCDMLYDEQAIGAPGTKKTINFGSMTVFRLTSGNYGLMSMKHDFWHRAREYQAGGHGVIGFASIHGADAAKSMGIRQTATYKAWGLSGKKSVRLLVQAKGSSSRGDYKGLPAAWTLLGVDPWGGVNSHDPRVLWSKPGNAVIPNWDKHRIEFDKPEDARALTVFLKWRDGYPDDTCDDAAIDGNNGWFDYVLVEPVEKE